MESESTQAIGYVRNSTSNQQKGGTIIYQQRAIYSFGTSNNILVKSMFSDEAVSGTVELSKRKGVLELIGFLETHREIKILIIYSLDRIARDLWIQEQFILLMKKYNIQILSLREPDFFGSDPTRTFIRQMLGATSQYEKTLITSRTIAGRINKARSGKFSGGRIPYGFSITQETENQKKSDLIINENQSKNIKLIFEMKAKKMSYRSIANYLNTQSVNSPSGGQKWFAASVRFILLNPIYRGVLNYKEFKTVRNDLAIVQ
jgi:site-specific DNA recombinase